MKFVHDSLTWSSQSISLKEEEGGLRKSCPNTGMNDTLKNKSQAGN